METEDLEILFDKRFLFRTSHDSEAWTLPDFSHQTKDISKNEFENADLARLKSELNLLKSSLNDFDITKWNQHTSNLNPAGFIVSSLRRNFTPELCTQAWCKFYEILGFNDIIPGIAVGSKKLKCIHLCEAPGAFICAMNHFVRSNLPGLKYSWIANTLNPYYEDNDPNCCIADDRLIFRSLDLWRFGEDNTGNLLRKENLKDLLENASKLDCVHIVTADGGISCQQNPEDQEKDCAALHFTELCFALNTLCIGGSFVLKIFTLFEFHSVVLIYILCCTFESICIQKPITSKPGNSELYVVAKDFRGRDKYQKLFSILIEKVPLSSEDVIRLFPSSCIPKDFISQHVECVTKFVRMQMQAIECNKLQFGQIVTDKSQLITHKQRVSQLWIDWLGLRKIPRNRGIVPSGVLRGIVESNVELRPKLTGSFNQRTAFDDAEKRVCKKKKIEDNTFNVTWHNLKTCGNQHSDFEIVIGRRISTIQISLFCNTGALIEYNKSEKMKLIGGAKFLIFDSVVCDFLAKFIMNSDQIYMADTNLLFSCGWDQVVARQNVIHIDMTCVDHNFAPSTVLLACLIESNITEELNCKERLLRTVTFVIKTLPMHSSFVLFFPSVLTRFSGGLIWLLCQSFQKYTVLTNTHPDSTPGLCLVFQGKLKCDHWHSHLDTVKSKLSEDSDFKICLEVVSVTELLYDADFVNSLRNANDQILSCGN